MAYTTFYPGPGWQQSSEPMTIVDVQESDLWPVGARSLSGAKDTISNGEHPVVAIGGRTAADGRPLNVTGVVVSIALTTAGTATDRVEVDIADGKIVRQYVSNIKSYSGGSAYAFETAPVVGQPVYVDDSADLSAGVTLSMSPFNSTGTLKNPMAGILFYCQTEIADGQAGGGRESTTFDGSLPDEETEQVYCVLLINNSRDLS